MSARTAIVGFLSHPGRAQERLAYVPSRLQEDGVLGAELPGRGLPSLPHLVPHERPRRDIAKAPAIGNWAFYPRTDHLRAKMDAEMPLWKQPFWYCVKWFKAWPFQVEALSGFFDFNHAPFLQSFMHVRVERSKRRVVLALNGVHRPLRWGELEKGGAVLPPGATLDDPVEFIVSIDRE